MWWGSRCIRFQEQADPNGQMSDNIHISLYTCTYVYTQEPLNKVQQLSCMGLMTIDTLQRFSMPLNFREVLTRTVYNFAGHKIERIFFSIQVFYSYMHFWQG